MTVNTKQLDQAQPCIYWTLDILYSQRKAEILITAGTLELERLKALFKSFAIFLPSTLTKSKFRPVKSQNDDIKDSVCFFILFLLSGGIM